eukprot:scaffold7168_cov102-Isochrysis_galbana.AAC.3
MPGAQPPPRQARAAPMPSEGGASFSRQTSPAPILPPSLACVSGVPCERLTPLMTGMASWCVRSSFCHGLESRPWGHQTAEPRLG